VSATVSGHTLTIARAAGPDPAGNFPPTATVSVTDGNTAGTVTVNFTGLQAGTNRCP